MLKFIDVALEISAQSSPGVNRRFIVENTCPWEFGLDEEYDCVGRYGCERCWNREYKSSQCAASI